MEQREQLCLNPPSDYKERIKELDEALVAEDSRHSLTIKKFKISRRSWRYPHRNHLNSRSSSGREL